MKYKIQNITHTHKNDGALDSWWWEELTYAIAIKFWHEGHGGGGVWWRHNLKSVGHVYLTFLFFETLTLFFQTHTSDWRWRIRTVPVGIPKSNFPQFKLMCVGGKFDVTLGTQKRLCVQILTLLYGAPLSVWTRATGNHRGNRKYVRSTSVNVSYIREIPPRGGCPWITPAGLVR